MARNLERIEQAKKGTGGTINHALDMVAVLIPETGDPVRVYDEVLHLLHEVRAERTAAATSATAA
ncbi:MAG: hypothetical protein QOF84_1881 [Streptomyces sp.]|nr:hypothetical protein [Streptomyces sp.]